MNTLRCSLVAVTALFIAAGQSAVAQADLHAAARAGDPAVVADLLAAGADVNASNAEGLTPLHLAALRGDAKTVQLLLAAGADVAGRDGLGRTPLHYAASAGADSVIERLLTSGADVNAVDATGQTPLLRAARWARLDTITALVAAGADLNARDAAGRTVFDVFGTDTRPDVDGTGDGGELDAPPTGYPTYDELVLILQSRAAQYPAICRLLDLGPAAGTAGRRLWALKITDNPDAQEDEPEFKYISTMHGDEIVGMEMCLYLIDLLLSGYGTEPRLTTLVNEVEIWIVPLMNPDGYMLNRRTNANGVDLNRNFPEGVQGDPNTVTGRAAETKAIMEWSFGQSFTLAANFHGGALVVNYPFDNDGLGSVFSPTPDEDLFVYISEEYSRYNLPMWNGSWYHGITNGAAWYSIDGGMQDWSYRYMGCNEVTIELGNTKSPPFTQIPGYWDNNRESMLAYLETCLIGVRGIVTDAVSGRPLAATVNVVGRNHNIYTDPDVGDYHRMLMPGTYALRFEAANHDPLVVSNVVVTAGAATRLDVQLYPQAAVLYPNGGENLPVNVPINVTWAGNPAAQFHVQQTANYGQTSVVNDGFESGTLGSAYTTGGNQPWYVVAGGAHSGSYSARAGAIGNSQRSWMTRAAAGGALSFWYRVSSEADYDWFDFYIDDVRQLHRSGTVAWTYYSTTLPPGEHTLRWEYSKDVSGVSGSDTAWIDDLELVTDATVWTDIVALTAPGATSVPWTPAVPSTSCKVRVRAYLGGQYSGWDESDAVFAVQAGGWPLGDLNCDHAVDFGDINPFVLALTNPAGYAQAFPNCRIENADINQDGRVDFGDINPFVRLLTGP